LLLNSFCVTLPSPSPSPSPSICEKTSLTLALVPVPSMLAKALSKSDNCR
jgi:hypothetical protein